MLVERYVDAALKTDEGNMEGNHRKVNKAHHERTLILSDMGNDLLPLKELFTHPNNNVRLWAAFDLLTHNVLPKESKAVLVELAEDPGIVGLGARVTLKRLQEEKSA